MREGGRSVRVWEAGVASVGQKREGEGTYNAEEGSESSMSPLVTEGCSWQEEERRKDSDAPTTRPTSFVVYSRLLSIPSQPRPRITPTASVYSTIDPRPPPRSTPQHQRTLLPTLLSQPQHTLLPPHDPPRTLLPILPHFPLLLPHSPGRPRRRRRDALLDFPRYEFQFVRARADVVFLDENAVREE